MLSEHEGVWLKGNLHIHTQRSDGRKAFDEAVALYEAAGYDFIAVTDHWVVSEQAETTGGMLLLSGCEYHVGANVREGIYHIVGVGMQSPPELDRTQPGLNAQMLIDGIRAKNGLAILAHPAWSLNSADCAAKLRGLSGTEIFNATSDFPFNARPYSGLFVDQLAAQGVLLPCMAADDVHEYGNDLCKGYLMVHAKEKTHEAVMEALRNGDFYATQGPRVRLTVEAGLAVVECSEAAHVVFYSDGVFNPHRVTQGNGVTQAVYPLMKHETYVRAEVTDGEGRTAYTSPVRIR